MREVKQKSYKERFDEYSHMYLGVSDFDILTILNLEDEYDEVTKKTPDHTRQRSEILDMRRKIMDRIRIYL